MKARWGGLALVGLGLGLGLGLVSVGCGAGLGSLSDDSPPRYAREPGVPRVRSEAEFPELPLDRYELSARDSERMQRAQAYLVRRCMRSFGFADFPLAPKPRGQMSESFHSTLTLVAVSP
ncbi:hypothetical protein [Streptomyces alboniger]|uniref:hypothetical protein n=1 Tax=Streptomyces alboniger TaxID=132473 RepID=UPI00123D1715|nr:hypothetical protein [Streptomyces alboniger]